MHQLGGAAIYLYTRDSQLGRGEPVEDAAQVISRMCDVIMVRTFEQDIIDRFGRNSRVPVINGLTNEYHPARSWATSTPSSSSAAGSRARSWPGSAIRTRLQHLDPGGGAIRFQAQHLHAARLRSRAGEANKNCESFADR